MKGYIVGVSGCGKESAAQDKVLLQCIYMYDRLTHFTWSTSCM